MKLLFICDINSIHAQKWVRFFIQRGHVVHIYSTAVAPPSFEGCTVYHNQAQQRESQTGSLLPRLAARVSLVERALEMMHIARSKRRWLSEVNRLAPRVRAIIQSLKPDAVCALRIPIEGFLAAQGAVDIPLAVSVWGNDLLFFAAEDARFRTLTSQTLKQCGILFSDCGRDLRLARTYGLPAQARTHIVPGAGGLPRALLKDAETKLSTRGSYFNHLKTSAHTPVLLNPRGFGSHSITNIPLLKAAAILRNQHIEFRLVLVGLLGTYRHRLLASMVERLGLRQQVHFIHHLPHDELMQAFQSSDFFVSCTRYDGVPNSMLEAMAWGAIPVMNGHESIREWIEDGQNGFLFNANNPKDIAEALLRALRTADRWQAIRVENHKLVRERGEYEANMSRVESALQEWLRL